MAKEPIILTNEIAPTPALVRAGMDALPAAILAYGERASRRFIGFFTATIRNRNTRTSYARAVKQFFDWCEDHRLGLDDIEPIAICRVYRAARHGNGQAVSEAAFGSDPSAVRLSGDGRYPDV
jgi:hypothetical protein